MSANTTTDVPLGQAAKTGPFGVEDDSVTAKRKALFNLLCLRDPGVVDEKRDRDIMASLKAGLSDPAVLASINEPCESVNAKTKTLLGKTIRLGYYDGARLLVESGADPFVGNTLSDAFSPLVVGYGEGALFLRWLLDHIARREDLSARLTAFFADHSILARDCLPFMDRDEPRAPQAPFGCVFPLATNLAIKYGADVSATLAGKGTTPLHFAARKGEARVVSALLNAGTQINSADDHGFTALHIAASKGRINVVEVLLDAGANPLLLARDCKDGISLVSAEFLARSAGHHETAQRIAAWIKWSSPMP
ncbi:ankyrin repeat protein [Mollivirus sibericum]|uniref:ankyrin repeat protein n=1 Tax=Mollivirus sibericum TaxID=1678078 RepID=UPI0006B2EA3B|nr:ankyrin repeat protein [Mollivirus sibericum]ALD61955.1 ankyrin repeat protein [Mollivirus sibericum]